MIENSAYRLAAAIKKTQKRANALKNITIPQNTQLSKAIADAQEEKEVARGVHTTEGHQTEKEHGKLISLSRNRDEKPAWDAKRFAVPGGFLCVMQKICFWLHFLCKNFIKIFYLFKTVFAIIRKAIVKKS